MAWWAHIGWFLESAAVAQVQHQRMHDQLAGHKVSQVMSRYYVAIAGGTTLQQQVQGPFRNLHH